MSTATSASTILETRRARSLARLATAVEVLLIYAAILVYIWRWQFTRPWVWMVLLAAIVASHIAHRDAPRDLGLTLAGMRANAQLVLPILVILLLPLLLYGLASRRLEFLVPGKESLVYFLAYGAWCVLQQYLTQSYFHNRLMGLLTSRHLSSVVVGVMFGAAHIPNPILMVATTAAGFIFSEAFARHRNIWPLALGQTAGGFLIAALSPASLVHNMRVGPGYLFYGLH